MTPSTTHHDPPPTRLFTPGPLTTSDSVRRAMLRDVGSRDDAFIRLVAQTRAELLRIAGVRETDFTAVPMQGSGTFGLEAAVGTLLPRDAALLVAVNGAYGRRLVEIARVLEIPVATVPAPETEPIDPGAVAEALRDDGRIRWVAAVHCETTTGLINPIEEIGRAVADAGRAFLVDAMSSFGGMPVDFHAAHIDALVSSSNKCLEGVPGFSFVIVRRSLLEAAAGQARSLSLDLVAQREGLDRNGQFRFTPPTHAMLAFRQALRELDDEGGVPGRAARYARNHRHLIDGMTARGFRPLLPPELRGHIITTFHHPPDQRFDFDRFYHALARRGMVIYPGKLGQIDCFRVGTIGRLDVADIDALLRAIDDVLDELGLTPAAPAVMPTGSSSSVLPLRRP